MLHEHLLTNTSCLTLARPAVSGADKAKAAVGAPRGDSVALSQSLTLATFKHLYLLLRVRYRSEH